MPIEAGWRHEAVAAPGRASRAGETTKPKSKSVFKMKTLTRSISLYTKSCLARSALGGTLLLASVAGSSAKNITIQFTAELNSVPAELSPPFAVNDEITGTFTYDPAAVQTPFFSNERDIPVAGSGTLAGYNFTFSGVGDNPGSSLRFIQKFPPATITDVIQIETSATGSPVNGYNLSSFAIRLAEGADLLPDLSNVPLDPLPLDEGLFINLLFLPNDPFEPNPFARLSGVTTSLRVLTPSAVPDAGGSLPLLGLACAGLAWVRRAVAA
jgi:hypothetical protein